MIAFIVLFISGCQSNQDNSSNNSSYKEIYIDDHLNMNEIHKSTVIVNFPQSAASLNLMNKFQQIRFIKLETIEKSLIRRIDKLLLDDEHIYVLDKSISKLVIFSLDGKYINTINRKGKGPGEYMGIKDFTLNGDSIVLFDDIGQKLQFFNGQGEYCYERSTGLRFRNIHKFQGANYIMAAGSAQNGFRPELEDYSILIGDPTDSIKIAGFKNNNFLKNFDYVVNDQLVLFENELLYSPYLSNIIYGITEQGGFYKKYFLNIINELPPDYYKKSSVENFHKYVQSNKITYFMGSFVENTRHLFLRLNSPDGEYAYLLYDKHGDTVFYYNRILYNDYFITFNFPLLASKNEFITAIDAHKAISSLNNFKNHSVITSESLDLLNSIQINDNPILMFYQLK